ncbi:MAG: phosphoribosylamine--glycine ligase [Lentimicrobium sp.]|jgi:phosphoribosylamine--glycine ligase|nr:phosphoribosylamine--glycine ligase [Lentimicrobium sp.]
MNVLLLGSGGREHAMAWKLSQSPLITQLYIAPGNAGTRSSGINLPIGINDFSAIKRACLHHDIQMLIVGPEEPLVNGIVDFFEADPLLQHIHLIGPGSKGAQLEGSKDFAKAFMSRHQIPTARYRTFTAEEFEEAKLYLFEMHPPYVIKADGLAAGKGVLICENISEAYRELEELLLKKRFGKSCDKVVIEEFLQGSELSLFVVTDGTHWKLLPEAKDYKRIGDGDKGPNTGGMGSVSPVAFADEEFMQKVIDRIVQPTIDGLKKDNILYKGFVFVGLINVEGNPFVIEYNVRLGDPETESVMPRITSDLMPVLLSLRDKTLNKQHINFDPGYALTVMLVSAGYPGDYPKGLEIFGLDKSKGVVVFHAGTMMDEKSEATYTAGGRVLGITSMGTDIESARRLCYQNAGIIDFLGKTYRTDIGLDLMKQN